ncbi:MAG: MlaD family protein, partial [Nevskiales bacterium]
MKYDTVNYTAVGSFVLLMLVTLGFALYHITGRHGRMDSYHVYYGNVAGVKFGTPVYFEGYPVGQVETVAPERREDGMRYRVSLAIQHDWPVPSDSIAAIASSGLLSDVSISIVEGRSREPLKPGAEIRGQEGADIFTAFNELAAEVKLLSQSSLKPLVQQLNDALGSGAGPIIADFRSLLEKLNHSADSLNEVLSPGNRRQVAQTLQHLNQASANTQ